MKITDDIIIINGKNICKDVLYVLYNIGFTQEEIAIKLNISHVSVSRIVKKLALPIRKHSNRKYDYDKIKEYYKTHNRNETAKEFGSSKSTMNYILHKLRIYVLPDSNGSNNPNWRGGIRYDRGRKMWYSPGHPYAQLVGKKKTPYVFEYRLVVEKSLGRYLLSTEIVHHIDNDHTNNNIDNLQVMTQSEHIKVHLHDK